ncbi:MAG: SRPBCC family protein [Nitriliruptoraceae bacterium]|nr:SRPBCC family protein [Nitriliruptoraceae bacterium]
MNVRVEGTVPIATDPARVEAALGDPEVIAHALPGASRVDRDGAGVLTVVTTIGLAGTRGTYRARIHPVTSPEDGWALRLAAAGEPGTVQAEVQLALAGEVGRTTLTYTVEAALEGRLAGLGRGVLEGAVHGLVRDLAEALPAASDAGVPAADLPGAGTPAAGVPAAGVHGAGAEQDAATPTPDPWPAPDTIVAPITVEPRRSGPLVAALVVAAATIVVLLARRWAQQRLRGERTHGTADPGAAARGTAVRTAASGS